MSFILDALRKSEHERQRGAVPGISHVPLAAPRREVPRWAFGVIGMLAVAVIVSQADVRVVLSQEIIVRLGYYVTAMPQNEVCYDERIFADRSRWTAGHHIA